MQLQTRKGKKTMSLYHKYRPICLEEVVGNESEIEIIRAELQRGDSPHAFLFYGPTGCGKTTLGRIVAKGLACKGNDFKEIDSADFRGIDTIREIRKQSQYLPMEGKCRVWLLDECHKLSSDAQNAMLKALEDTPSHVYYILSTTEPQKLLPTIKGRCSQHQVTPLSDSQMFSLLRKVIKNENENLQKIVYKQIIQDSLGSPRNALQILDQVLSVPSDQRLLVARKQAEMQSQVIELCRALLSKTGWKKISNVLSDLQGQGQEPESIKRAIIGYFSSVLLKEDNMIAGLIIEEFLKLSFYDGFPGIIFACYSIIKLGGKEK